MKNANTKNLLVSSFFFFFFFRETAEGKSLCVCVCVCVCEGGGGRRAEVGEGGVGGWWGRGRKVEERKPLSQLISVLLSSTTSQLSALQRPRLEAVGAHCLCLADQRSQVSV